MIVVGIDVGTNSVGSAWIDTERRIVDTGVGIFPAGVDESTDKRGAPKNQDRRVNRLVRRMTRRRGERKRAMARFLTECGWMPADPAAQKEWMSLNPWHLRRDGLKRELSPEEFGRILLHMVQRRGPVGLLDEDDKDAKVVKKALDHTRQRMAEMGAETFGHFMANLFDERRVTVGGAGNTVGQPIRNRSNALGEPQYEFWADRDMLRAEFQKIWDTQKTFGGPLAAELDDALLTRLDNESADATFRHRGLLFGQRKTYWDKGLLARCDLEPTDQRCPKADRHAQEFLVLETVNNIRISRPGETMRPLVEAERQAVLAVLNKQKTANAGTVRVALKINRPPEKENVTLSLDRDPKRALNTNWFEREIVASAIGREAWDALTGRQKESVNRALLTFDKSAPADEKALCNGCRAWWGLDGAQTERLLEAWKSKSRPSPESRCNLSRRAILNLLPYMREQGATVTEARQRFAEDADNGASDLQRRRYSLRPSPPNKAMRHYLAKHPDLLPPAPELTNPVVRKAIHEVRRHLAAYLRKYGRKPDRVIVEMAREARLTAKRFDKALEDNRQREKIKKEIIQKYGLAGKSKNEQRKAVDRVRLCREQNGVCAYTVPDKVITERMAAEGYGLEIDHIIPRSRGGSNGLVNKVLCFTAANRGKGNSTPREWLDDEKFNALLQRFRFWKDKPENKGKWAMLSKEVKKRESFVPSALSDTAYAATELVRWLEGALYNDEDDDIRDGRRPRRVFSTNGSYTALLRHDWGLYFPDGDGDTQGQSTKYRGDHRHHALDAVLVALSGPERIGDIHKAWEIQEIARAKGLGEVKRQPLPTPPEWGCKEALRQHVLAEVMGLIVSHRPAKKKLAGSLHNEKQYGPISGIDNEFTKRIPVYGPRGKGLKPNHLKVPEGWKELSRQYHQAHSAQERKALRRRVLALPDVKTGKSGVVRDRWFREELRELLSCNGQDPDNFNTEKIKELVQAGKFVLPSGVPIRRIRLRITLNRAARFQRKRYDPATGRVVYDTNPKADRVYESQNNHHAEIREDASGRWRGTVVTNFEATARVRPPKASGRKPAPAVDRSDNETGRFVMSLSEGEMLYMKHPSAGVADYFVVFKLDAGAINVTPHYDAGRSQGAAQPGEPARDENNVPFAKLKTLGPDGGAPYKVWVSPLGDVKRLEGD